jgi:hypothetical protein
MMLKLKGVGKESPVKESPVKESPVKESPVKESPVKRRASSEYTAVEWYTTTSQSP